MEPNGSSSTAADLAGAAATQVRPGGAPARVYMNEKLVPHVLEGMKTVVRDQYVKLPLISSVPCFTSLLISCVCVCFPFMYRPPDPLRVLGEFLIKKSEEQNERN